MDDISKKDVKDLESMQMWLDCLEKVDVFFSSPLDIDFLMLENFLSTYQKTLLSSEGPRLEVCDEDGNKHRYLLSKKGIDGVYGEELKERIKKDVHATLKEHGGTGETYTEEQKKLMIWYNYFFLNRGKTSTHISAFSRLEDQTLIDFCPEVIGRLIAKVVKKLEDEGI